MSRRVALYGGSFDPPTRAHQEIVSRLARDFDEVIVVPCGPRPITDKPTVNDTPAIHRAVMADMAFAGLGSNIIIDLTDLELAFFTRTVDLLRRYNERGDITVVIGSDLIKDGSNDGSKIHNVWVQGRMLWNQAEFLVIERQGYPINKLDLPPHAQVFHPAQYGSSTEARNLIFNHHAVRPNLMDSRIHEYILRYGLYRGHRVSSHTELTLSKPRFILAPDATNPETGRILCGWPDAINGDDPNLIVTIGGDGTMLKAVRNFWRRRLPFFGINAGHRGFLLNQPDVLEQNPFAAMSVWHLPLLYVETRSVEGGEWKPSYAFNDAWVERSSGQTAWVEVKVNGQTRLPRVMCDGVLLATAAGSTAYAHAMGAPVLPIGTPALVLVGSNVTNPAYWQPVVLSLDATVEFRVLNSAKRPVRGYVDGEERGPIAAMRIRVSQIASCELAFPAGHDMAEKLALIQFPQK